MNRKIEVKIDDYTIKYEVGEDSWMVFGRDEDVYNLPSDVDVAMDVAERMQRYIDGNKPINS